ncbi:MAG: hypothetical protein IPH76_06200 [Xanthomonadales bacterium]|nr:hypothetical protein [Xanthomonadales bacterium]
MNRLRSATRALQSLLAALALMLPLVAMALPRTDPQQLWRDVERSSVPARGERWIEPQTYRAMTLDYAALQAQLARAGEAAAVEITLPVPDGGFARFAVVESLVVEPALLAKYPTLRTYAGSGIDDVAASVRLDASHLGFHAQVLSPSGDFLIDPLQTRDNEHYAAYYRRDHVDADKHYRCETDDAAVAALPKRAAPVFAKGTPNTIGPALRTLRLAMAATSAYTNTFGGSVADGLAGLTTLVNRLNGVYQRDIGVRLVLVANNDLIVYTTANPGPLPDPPSNHGQNQSVIDAAIGSANYDLGHAVGGGGSGGSISRSATSAPARKPRATPRSTRRAATFSTSTTSPTNSGTNWAPTTPGSAAEAADSGPRPRPWNPAAARPSWPTPASARTICSRTATPTSTRAASPRSSPASRSMRA